MSLLGGQSWKDLRVSWDIFEGMNPGHVVLCGYRDGSFSGQELCDNSRSHGHSHSCSCWLPTYKKNLIEFPSQLAVCLCSRRAPIWQEVHSWVQYIFGGTSSQDPLCQLWRHLPDQLLITRGILPGLPHSCWGITFEGKCRLFPELEDLNSPLPKSQTW